MMLYKIVSLSLQHTISTNDQERQWDSLFEDFLVFFLSLYYLKTSLHMRFLSSKEIEKQVASKIESAIFKGTER